MSKPLNILYDPITDTVIAEGFLYAGVMFRSMALARPGTWLRIEDRGDGRITVFEPDEGTMRAFDAITLRSAQLRSKKDGDHG